MACPGCCHTLTSTARFTVDQEKVKDFLVAHGVVKGGIICPGCFRPVSAKFRGNLLSFRCGLGSCRRKSSAKTGTFVEGKLSLDLIVSFVSFFLLGNKPFHPLVSSELPISKGTITDWSAYCREVCIDWVIRESAPIGGEGVVVEIDVIKFGEAKDKHGKESEAHWVFGAVERDNSEKFCLVPIESQDKKTLLSLLQDWILPGSTIVSDCWKSYRCLKDEKFLQLKEQNSLEFVDIVAFGNEDCPLGQVQIVQMNMIERKWISLKKSLPSAGRRKEFFTGYLAEHLFKCRVPREERMHTFFLAAGRLFPPP